MRFVGRLLLVAALGGCAQKPAKETPMPTPDAPAEPTVSFLLLGGDDQPPWLKRRITEEPPHLTVAEVGALEPAVQSEVLEFLGRIAAHLRKEGERYRSLHNPKDRAAAGIERFIAAVRK